MKNKNGFTLVELLAVIVILGLLLTIAIPSALKMQRSVKEKSYATKINLIESSAQSYGQDNRTVVKSSTYYCKPSTNTSTYTTTKTADNFPCIRISVEELVNTNNLNWDEKNACTAGVAGCNENYSKIVVNPVSNNIINKCYIYVYFKNNRIYAIFDKTTCDNLANSPTDGREYKKLID